MTPLMVTATTSFCMAAIQWSHPWSRASGEAANHGPRRRLGGVAAGVPACPRFSTDRQGRLSPRDPDCLLTYLPRAFDDELVGTELGQAHRAAGVEAVGADADFGAVTELVSVREARTRVPIDGRAVDLREETPGGRFIGRDDGVAVARAVAIDRCDGDVERIDDPDCEHVVEKFRSIVRWCRGRRGNVFLFQNGRAGGIATQLDALSYERAGGGRQKTIGNVAVHEQLLSGIADARPGNFRVERDRLGHREV